MTFGERMNLQVGGPTNTIVLTENRTGVIPIMDLTLSKRIEMRFVLLLLLLLLLLPNVFAHFTKIAITWPFIKLGPPDFAW